MMNKISKKSPTRQATARRSRSCPWRSMAEKAAVHRGNCRSFKYSAASPTGSWYPWRKHPAMWITQKARATAYSASTGFFLSVITKPYRLTAASSTMRSAVVKAVVPASCIK